MDKVVKEFLDVTLQIEVTDEDIDDIMCAALEGGITYWCDEAEPEGDYLGEWGHEQISRGGTLFLHDCEEDEYHKLNKENFIDGLKKFICSGRFDIVDRLTDKYGTYTGKLGIDACQVDGEAADGIIQCALFGDWIYG